MEKMMVSQVDRTRLAEKKVVLIGAGALGSVIAQQLVSLGVGYVTIADRDFVELSNLQRQMVYDETDVKAHLPKAIATAHKLSKRNSITKLTPLVMDVNHRNIESLVQDADLLLDGTDNWQIRYLINDVSIKYQIPWIYGAVLASRGTVASILPGQTPCLRCLFDQPLAQHGQTCDTMGVLGPLVQIIASIQVAQGLKILLEQEDLLLKDMLHVDIWDFDLDFLPTAQGKNVECPCCQHRKFEYLHPQDLETVVTSLCGRQTIQISNTTLSKPDLAYWQKKWSKLGKVERNPFLLRFTYGSYTLVLFTDGRLLIQGTDDPVVAKQLYHQLMGG